MRVGSLLVQIVAILLAIALIAGGYYVYRMREVRAFSEKLNSSSVKSFQDLADLLENAPSAYCVDSGSNFEGAFLRTRVFHDGKASLVMSDRANAFVSRSVYDDGWYLWDYSADEIVFVSIEKMSARALPSELGSNENIYSESTCSVWWNPDESMFDIPANMPIIEA